MPTNRISVEWTDAEGDTLRVPTYWDAASLTTLAEADAAFQGFVTLVGATAGPAITKGYITFELTPASPESPDGGYSVYTGAYLSTRNSDGRGDGLYIPGILNSQISNKVVDLGTTQMIALKTAIESGGFGTNNARISTADSGSLWDVLLKGKRSNRKA